MNYSNYAEYLRHPAFLESVASARKRAAGKCERCDRETKTEPHHIAYCKWGRFDPPENLKMLCRECHEDAHRCQKCGNVNLKAWHIKNGLDVCFNCCNHHQ